MLTTAANGHTSAGANSMDGSSPPVLQPLHIKYRSGFPGDQVVQQLELRYGQQQPQPLDSASSSSAPSNNHSSTNTSANSISYNDLTFFDSPQYASTTTTTKATSDRKQSSPSPALELDQAQRPLLAGVLKRPDSPVPRGSILKSVRISADDTSTVGTLPTSSATVDTLPEPNESSAGVGEGSSSSSISELPDRSLSMSPKSGKLRRSVSWPDWHEALDGQRQLVEVQLVERYLDRRGRHRDRVDRDNNSDDDDDSGSSTDDTRLSGPRALLRAALRSPLIPNLIVGFCFAAIIALAVLALVVFLSQHI